MFFKQNKIVIIWPWDAENGSNNENQKGVFYSLQKMKPNNSITLFQFGSGLVIMR